MDFMDSAELGTLLGVHVATLARWRMANKGPAWYEVGGQFRYLREDVDRWLASQRREGGTGHEAI